MATLVGPDHHRARQLGQDDLGHPVGHVDRLDVGADHDEFVAAEAGDGVGAATGLGQPVGQLPQGQVAHVVAEEVVHGLEPVHVDEEDGQGRMVPAADGQGLVDPVVEQGPVGQARERVVEGLVLREPLQAGGEVPVLGHQGPVGQPPAHGLDEGFGGHGLQEISVDLPDGGQGRLEGGLAGQEEDGEGGFPLLQVLGQFHAVAVGEEKIDDDQGRGVVGVEGEGLLGAGGADGGDAGGGQDGQERSPGGDVVVHHEDRFGRRRARRGPLGRLILHSRTPSRRHSGHPSSSQLLSLHARSQLPKPSQYVAFCACWGRNGHG
jgi:hypothetical protein